MEATSALLEEGTPYPELGIERIATRAGISRTAFYFYFRDKREVLMRLARDVTEQVYAQADIWLSGGGDPAEEVRAALRNIGDLYRRHGAILRAVADGATSDEELGEFWRAALQRFVDAARARIETDRSAGQATATNPAATAFALAWTVERTFHQQLVQDDAIPADQLVDAVAEIWIRAVYAR
jgi:TetR/AcrR family transcriptional regulator, ethionamide resistance regulator